MAKSNVFILLDRSGSMYSHWNETLGSINGYIKELKKQKALSKATLAVFDDISYELVRDSIKASDWQDISEKEADPRGLTPLYDSVVKMVANIENVRTKRNTLVVITDGQENASKEATKDSAKAAIKKLEDKGFDIVFLGANFDAMKDSGAIGISIDQTLNMTQQNYGATMKGLAERTVSYTATGTVKQFTEEDRARAVGDLK